MQPDLPHRFATGLAPAPGILARNGGDPELYVGAGPGHHGEILQGVFRDDAGRLHRGLVSLPCPLFNSVAWARQREAPGIELDPPEKVKVRKAVALLIERRALSHRGMMIRVRNNIPAGFGLGSSTADILAALRAVARACGIRLVPTELFGIAVEAELASDGTMFTRCATLVAHREGKVIERYQRSLPPLGLISANMDPAQPVPTTDFPPARYDATEIAEFGQLRGRLRIAIATSDPAAIGQVSSMSAAINQRHLPQPLLPDIRDIARRHRAYGIQVAHSGRMVGLLIPPDLDHTDRRVAGALGSMREIGLIPVFLRRVP